MISTFTPIFFIEISFVLLPPPPIIPLAVIDYRPLLTPQKRASMVCRLFQCIASAVPLFDLTDNEATKNLRQEDLIESEDPWGLVVRLGVPLECDICDGWLGVWMAFLSYSLHYPLRYKRTLLFSAFSPFKMFILLPSLYTWRGTIQCRASWSADLWKQIPLCGKGKGDVFIMF